MHRVHTLTGHLKPAFDASASCVSSAPTSSLLNRLGNVQDLVPLGDMVISEKNGGQLVAQVLKAHGVKWLFTLVGGHISPILVASEQIGIRIIDVRHEVTAVFAADAVARLSGVPGVAAVTAGPGITNTITAIKNAQMAQSPLVLIGGAAATMLKGRGALQDIDQLSLVKSIVKWSTTCPRVRDIVPALRQAFKEAQSGVPGPVFVEFPIDVLYPICEVSSGMGLADRKLKRDITEEMLPRVLVPVEVTSKGGTAKEYLDSKQSNAPVFLAKAANAPSSPTLVNWYLQYQLRTLFAGAWQQQDITPLPVFIPMPESSQISATLNLLLKAKRPVLVIASQATLMGRQVQQLQEAVLSLGIPTFLSGMARGLLGRNHKYHIRQNRGKALAEADVVILAGAVCDFRMEYGRCLNRKSSIVAVNRSPIDIQLNSGMFWSPTVTCICDPHTFLVELAKVVGKHQTSHPPKSVASAFPGRYDDWASKLKTAESKKEAGNANSAAMAALGHGEKAGTELINPIDLFFKLEDLLPDNAILVADGGDFVATASYILRPRSPLSWLDPGAFGTLGVGGGFALGAKLVRPESEVWIIWGDGSAGYSMAEYDTFKRHNVPVIGLIGNDACWTQIERDQVPMFSSDVACPLSYSAYHLVAKGYGGEGIEIQSPSDNQGIVAVLQEAQRLASQGIPVAINAHIGKTAFREGSISV